MWLSLDVLACIPASSGSRDGSDLGLIPDVFDEMDVEGCRLCVGIFCANDRLSEDSLSEDRYCCYGSRLSENLNLRL